MSTKIITGQRFGRLTAVRPTEKRKNGTVVWECSCDCGNIICVLTSNLKNGSTRSCGCLRKEFLEKGNRSLKGKRFGRLTALQPTKERSKGGSVIWECRCDCGNTVFVVRSNLNSGNTQSCGCLLKERYGRQKK